MKAANYLVTYTDLTTMGLYTKSTPPTGNRIGTKSFINTYYYVNPANISGYADSQCVPYQNIVGIFGATVNYASNTCDACNAPTGSVNVSADTTSFCTAAHFYSASFATFASGNYVLVYGGNSVNVSTTFGNTTATVYGGGCSTCPSSTPVWTYVHITCVSCTNTNVYQDTAICSATYGYYRIGDSGTPQINDPSTGTCNTNENWVDNGAAFCDTSANPCVAYQPQIDNNPCSATHNQTRNYSLGQVAPCNYDANYVYLDQYCYGYDLYNRLIDDNPCSPTYNNIIQGSLVQANDFGCGFQSTQVTLYYGSSQSDACNAVNTGYFYVVGTSSSIYTGLELFDDAHCLNQSPAQYYADGSGVVWYGNPLGSAADCPI